MLWCIDLGGPHLAVIQNPAEAGLGKLYPVKTPKEPEDLEIIGTFFIGQMLHHFHDRPGDSSPVLQIVCHAKSVAAALAGVIRTIETYPGNVDPDLLEATSEPHKLVHPSFLEAARMLPATRARPYFGAFELDDPGIGIPFFGFSYKRRMDSMRFQEIMIFHQG
jgi:hypothetical protein